MIQHESQADPELADVNRKHPISELRLFKVLATHVLVFALLVGSLSGFEWVLNTSHLANERTELMGKVEFYIDLLALVIFSASFITKVLLCELAGIKRW